MITLKNQFIYIFFSLIIFSGSFLFVASNIQAQEASEKPKKEIKYRKARALQSSTAKKMAKVYEALERVNDVGDLDPDMETVTNILTELRNDSANLKSYDRSVMWNAWGYVYFSDEKYDQAIQAYEKTISEPEVTIPIRVQALLTMGQLYMVQGNYRKGVELILDWMSEVETVTAQSWGILGQAYFQLEDHKKSMSAIEKAIQLAE